MPRPQSLAITFFLFGGLGRIFELMIKESRGEGGDGKGITPCSRSALVPIIPLSRFSLVSSTPL